MLHEVKNRLAQINKRRDWLMDNLEGCDWCCGGGDEEWEELRLEESVLKASLRCPNSISKKDSIC